MVGDCEKLIQGVLFKRKVGRELKELRNQLNEFENQKECEELKKWLDDIENRYWHILEQQQYSSETIEMNTSIVLHQRFPCSDSCKRMKTETCVTDLTSCGSVNPEHQSRAINDDKSSSGISDENLDGKRRKLKKSSCETGSSNTTPKSDGHSSEKGGERGSNNSESINYLQNSEKPCYQTQIQNQTKMSINWKSSNFHQILVSKVLKKIFQKLLIISAIQTPANTKDL